MDALNKNINFPFSAVQGQSLFKLALLLTTVNPLIGGVLISGPRGCAKSTLARAVSDLLPIKDNVTPQFVSLPLGASEEMLIGTLDLDHVLQDKSLKFSPGLLKKAHQGVLYVDEVNLLPDHLVDQLLDVASSGVNIVERDGISHRHDARFTLIGTMNPDEGELRPQLQDRFGLMVELDNIYTLEERINIIKARQHFDKDNISFCDKYQAEQILLQQQINEAQALLPKVTCDDDKLVDIAMRCQEANVDGLRADIIMHRASVTHAAWCGRTSVIAEDIEQVAALVLLHRQQNTGMPPSSNSSSPNQPSTSKNENQFSRPQAPQGENASSTSLPEQENQHQDGLGKQQNMPTGEWGAMPAQSGEVQQANNALKINLSRFEKASLTQTISNDFSADIKGKHKGNNAKGGRKSQLNSLKPDWFSTFVNSVGHWPPQQFSLQKRKTGEHKLHLILLDTSASTITDSLSALAKSVVMSITDNAYLKRDKISLLGFGNDQVETILKAGRSPKKITKLLNEISAIGGTPLRLVLEKASQSIKQLEQKYPGISLFCYLITDGRSRVELNDLKLHVPTLLIDIEKAQIKRGRGKIFAQQLGAQYIALTS